jgi:hypothetical protein
MTRDDVIRRLAAKNPGYSRYLSNLTGIAESPPPSPCIHIGAVVRGAEAPDLQRDWHRCDHPKRVELGIAEVVCSCRGCNAKCEGYEV